MNDPRLGAILEQMQHFAGGDLAFRGKPSDADDELDAILVGLNMLAEDFQVQQGHAEEALEDALELFEQAPIMMCSITLASGALRRANGLLKHHFGESGLVGLLLRDLFEEAHRPAIDAALEGLRAGESVRDLELQVVPASGSAFAVLFSATRDPGSARARCTLVDIEERRRLERQLLQAQKMEAVGRLAGGIAHDFNNLLTVIQNNAVFVRETLPDGTLAAEDLDMLMDAGSRAAELVSQLLAFSRRQIVRPQVVDVNTIVGQVHRLLERLIGENIHTALVLTPDCWPTRIDSNQFEQVIVNLAVNARDAMPDGGKLTIETQNIRLGEDYAKAHLEVEPGDYVMLAVTDEGTGMSEETVSHVFEPFFTTKPPHTGTGLGLATCYGIVRQAGGHIWVYSELGHGTIFKIYLPRVGQSTEVRSTESRRNVQVGGSETILLLEDAEDVRTITKRILERAGYTVAAVSTGAEALREFERRSGGVDLLLTDVVLRHTTGHAVVDTLHKTHPGLRVVYISGYTDNSIIHRGVLDPGVDFLPKPFRPVDLLRRVRASLDR